jgi:glycosyltransferase involved in cell wall biosynthesis
MKPIAYEIVIPARNEEETISDVVRAAKRARGAQRVVVVDDHSTDDTQKRARDAGAEVIVSRKQASKAEALATGVAATSCDVLVFFDADILHARPEHFESLALPVLSGDFDMCCGLVDYGALRNPIFLRLPPITGLRGVRRNVFERIPPEKVNGFQIEIMINEVIARNELPTAIRVLDGIDHRSKVAKLGAIKGLKAHFSMTMELLDCFRFVPLWTYGSYLRNLTVLTSQNNPTEVEENP